ncbi:MULTISPECIES: CC0125/CC1285 family lipoprotein [unclassified Brevundimonas]|uniref:CC0125/CC1285 family lipoprotein n=1 Tax=unclassified Brevundimonas TaxID=2622653 RepID=UPI003F939E65
MRSPAPVFTPTSVGSPFSHSSRRRALVAAALGAALAACSTATPYQPMGAPSSEGAGGYSDVQLQPDRWRVTFAGNSLTSRDTVETYLLYRAAELTVQSGYDWFTTAQRSTDATTQAYAYPIDRPWGPAWGPRWRYHDGIGVWRRWDPWGSDPFFDVDLVTQYEASAEIIMGRGAKPADDPHAFEARSLMDALSSQIVRPR